MSLGTQTCVEDFKKDAHVLTGSSECADMLTGNSEDANMLVGRSENANMLTGRKGGRKDRGLRECEHALGELVKI